ncbi:hypothetical protein [Mesorhizobium sp.]
MDALPIVEASKKPWTSEIVGKMHACGDALAGGQVPRVN